MSQPETPAEALKSAIARQALQRQTARDTVVEQSAILAKERDENASKEAQ